MTKVIAKNITMIRRGQGKTQDYTAKALGISRASYCSLERGNRDISISCLEKLSIIFDISVEQLIKPCQDEPKYEQMLFYILSFFGDKGIPKTKLAKITYLSDFSSYYLRRKPISGASYVNRPYGPVASIFLDLIDELWEEGKIRIRSLSDGAMIISSSSFHEEYKGLSPTDRKIIKDVCMAWKNVPTREIVNYTHEQKPWSMTRRGDYIPYDLILEERKEHLYKPV